MRWKLHLLSRDEVKQIEYGKQSLMPSDYDKKLNADDFRNLLAFLSRQGHPPAVEGSTRGGQDESRNHS